MQIGNVKYLCYIITHPCPDLKSTSLVKREPNIVKYIKVRDAHGKHGDVIKWKHFKRYWPFVWGIHRSPVNSPHKGQWRGALVFSLICAWTNCWVNNRDAGDLRRHRVHYDFIVMHVHFLSICVQQIRCYVHRAIKVVYWIHQHEIWWMFG